VEVQVVLEILGLLVCHEGLFEHLRVLRKEIADRESVPPYVVFHDRTLRQIAAVMPEKLAEMNGLYGLSIAKMEKYGEDFSDAVARYLKLHPEVVNERVKLSELNMAVKKSKPAGGETIKRELSETFKITLEMIKQGMNAEEIAANRELKLTTIEGHVARFFEEGELLNIRDYVTEDEEKLCLELLKKHGYEMLKPVYEAAGEKLSYGVIKIVLAVHRSSMEFD
jgi:ATP-dependent DNA helicase RecQ